MASVVSTLASNASPYALSQRDNRLPAEYRSRGRDIEDVPRDVDGTPGNTIDPVDQSEVRCQELNDVIDGRPDTGTDVQSEAALVVQRRFERREEIGDKDVISNDGSVPPNREGSPSSERLDCDVDESLASGPTDETVGV